MMTRGQFVDMMTRWADVEDRIKELDHTVYHLFGIDLGDLFTDYQELLCDAMTFAVDDRWDWIPYFAWERNFDLSKPCVRDAADRLIDTSDWGKVYDLIEEGPTVG